MHMTIDEDSGIPIWLQLRNRLIYLITSGAFAPGDKLPTMRQLAVDLGINYNTVSRVYQDIERVYMSWSFCTNIFKNGKNS